MKTDTETSFLDDALKFVSRESQHHVADALACYLHNDGNALQGNTEESDVEWFARRLYEQQDFRPRWDLSQDGERDKWRFVAKTVIAVLPAYQMRVAHRLITLSKVVRDIDRAVQAKGKEA